MSLPDKHYFYASDAVTDEDVSKKARVNYEQIIIEVARSGHDSDDKGLDWRIMNVMATEEKTTDVTQTLVFTGPSDFAGARCTVGGYATDETPEAMPQTQRSASCQLDTARRHGDLGWAHTSGASASSCPDEEQCGRPPPSGPENPLDQVQMCFEAHEVANCTLCPNWRTFDGISGTCLVAEATLEEVEVTPLADANLEGRRSSVHRFSCPCGVVAAVGTLFFALLVADLSRGTRALRTSMMVRICVSWTCVASKCS